MTAVTMAGVLIDHQRHNASSCLCGWAKLGHSHPEHQAAVLTAAGFGSIADTLGMAANELDGLFSYGAGMNYDGTEDRDMMTAIQATHEAAEVLRERATKAREAAT